MAKIIIEIDCKNDFCGQCRFKDDELSMSDYCSLFYSDYVSSENNQKRLSECIEAEVKASIYRRSINEQS